MAKRPQSRRRPTRRTPTKRTAKSRNVNAAAAAGGTDDVRTKRQAMEARPPIFGPDTSDVIPGELVVQLREDTAARITESISRGPRRAEGANSPRSFGIDEIDAVLNRLKVEGIVRVFPPAPITSRAMEFAAPMAATFRLTFDPDADVERAIEQLSDVDGVEFVEPNRYRETYATPNDPSFAAQHHELPFP